MEGHWEWSDSSGDDADTADLGGDGGHDLGHDLGHNYGGADGGEFNTDFGGQFSDGSLGADDPGGPDTHPGGDDLEEPLGTEHAAEDYDQSVNAEFEQLDLHGADQHPAFTTTDADPGDADDTTHGSDGSGAAHTDGAASDGQDGHQLDGQTDDQPHGGTDGGAEGGADDQFDGQIDGPDDHDGGWHDGEAAFGTDPDVDASSDDPAWHDAPFPAELHLDNPPEPVDGFPWTDVDVLGGPDHDLSAAYDPAGTDDGPPAPADLASYAGADLPAGTDPWSLLLGSEDPATSSLAGFWAPQI